MLLFVNEISILTQSLAISEYQWSKTVLAPQWKIFNETSNEDTLYIDLTTKMYIR